jgi:AbrB family looped-hinge helix DNA binding protein
MTTITVSPKFQIVIPKKTREKFKIKAGMKLVLLEYGKTLKLIPLRPLKELKGSLKGILTSFERETDREL